MNPGRFEEHPIPLMVTTSWGWIWSPTSAFWSEDNTPKSPQPGHQSGSTFPLKSASVSLLESGSTTVAMCPPYLVALRAPNGGLFTTGRFPHASNHNLVRRHGKLRFARHLFFNGIDNMMGHERLAVIFADITIGNVACFTSQIAGELSTVIVLDNDRAPSRGLQDFDDRFSVQRNQPANLKLIGGYAFGIENLHGLTDHALRGTPSDQGNVRARFPHQVLRRHRSFNASNLALPLFHHGAALVRVGELVADQHAILIVFVGGGGVHIPRYTGNRAWGDPGFGDLVPFVSVLAVRRICGGVGGPARMPDQGGRRWEREARRIKRRCTDRGLAGGPDANRCNQFTAINFNVEIEILGIDGRPAFRQQQIRQNDSRTLEPVGEIVHFGNQLET